MKLLLEIVGLTRGEKIYLSPIMDLFNGEIVSYRIQTRPTFNLVDEMLKGTLEKLGASEKPILHSDQGWQYQMFFIKSS